MARGKKKAFMIRGATAEMSGGRASQVSPDFGRKSAGLKVRKGHSRSKRQRKIASGRM
jgi:hypothetical protein